MPIARAERLMDAGCLMQKDAMTEMLLEMMDAGETAQTLKIISDALNSLREILEAGRVYALTYAETALLTQILRARARQLTDASGLQVLAPGKSAMMGIMLELMGAGEIAY